MLVAWDQFPAPVIKLSIFMTWLITLNGDPMCQGRHPQPVCLTLGQFGTATRSVFQSQCDTLYNNSSLSLSLPQPLYQPLPLYSGLWAVAGELLRLHRQGQQQAQESYHTCRGSSRGRGVITPSGAGELSYFPTGLGRQEFSHSLQP